ncbi:manganase accumulation protein MntS [Enterobacteriaceae bacterium 4M9]|nr:manganase accumulation protein MntS [Enterobacteriaceae bacterium 4M9]
MNEVKRCLRVFTQSPLKVRLQLLNMLCGLMNTKTNNNNTVR